MNGNFLIVYVAGMLQDNVLFDMAMNEVLSDDFYSYKILTALNDALSEISQKFPVYLKKTVQTESGDIPLKDICSNGAFTVARVTAEGKDVPFTVDSLGVHVKSGGAFDVMYAPEVFGVYIGENFEVSTDVGYIMLIHLIARNYCMLSGRTEEAAMYDSRYKDYAETISLKRRAHIPARKFV